MRRILMIILLGVVPFLGSAQVLRTWTGASNNDFNNGNNWSPTGALGTNDSCVITLTSSTTITMSASVTIRALDFRVSGSNRVGRFSTGSSLLTLNNTGRFKVASGNNNTQATVDVNGSGSGIIFGGRAIFDDAGVRTVLVESNTNNPGRLEFRSDVVIGPWGRTAPGTEPDIWFDKDGSQTLTENGTVTLFLGESVIVGVSNTPTLTINGTSAAWFGLYNGAFTVKAGATVNGGNCGFNTWAGLGTTCTFGAGSYVSVASTNNFPGPFTTYSLNQTSTFEYNGTSQSVTAIGGTGYGNLIINSSTTGTSAGNFDIQGNFTNTRGWNDGNDVHRFDGTGAQSINGAVKPVFWDIIVNKSSGTLTLNTDVDVDIRVQLQNGAVDLNNNTLSLLVLGWYAGGSPTAIVRTNGYIISESETSELAWMIRHSNSAHNYAFGNSSGTYIPWSYHVQAGTVGMFTAATWSTPTTNNVPWATGVTAMYDPTLGKDGSQEAVIDRWWVLTNAPSNSGNVVFRYAGAENTMWPAYNTSALGLQRWNTSTGKWDTPIGSGTGVTSGVGTCSANGVSAWSPWVISSALAPLPVELLDIQVIQEKDKVKLDWTTLTEINNDRFEIERSSNGQTWEKIGTIKGAGNSEVQRSYSLVDEDPLKGVSYYRLRQVDHNGEDEYFDPVAVNFEQGGTANVYPNPVQDQLYVNLSDIDAGEVQMTIVDPTGKKVLHVNEMAHEGQNLLLLNTSDLAPGMYLVNITTPGKSFSKAVVVK